MNSLCLLGCEALDTSTNVHRPDGHLRAVNKISQRGEATMMKTSKKDNKRKEKREKESRRRSII